MYFLLSREANIVYVLLEMYEWRGLTVGVQESEGVTGGNRGTQQASGYEAFSFSLADHAHNAQLLQVLIQLVLQNI